MRPATRVIVNTAAQYLRTGLTVLITLYTSSLVLRYLGADDYGIFTLVGAVLSMLAFIQSNLARSIQRFLSFYHGRQDADMLRSLFNNSLITQIVITVALCAILAAIGPWLFDTGLFRIPPQQRSTALTVYYIAVGSLVFNLLSTPYLAVLIARENIVFSSAVQVVDTLLKIPIALSLIWIASGRLTWYAVMTGSLTAVNFICYFAYCRRYEECRVFSLRDFRWKQTRDMMSFMGWTVYGTGCVAARNQGVQIIFNHFYSTVINAAYGLAIQVSAQISVLATSLTTAINPQIVKAEGARDRGRMLMLAESSCKISFLLMTMFVVPVCCQMEDILTIWLGRGRVPEYTGLFCSALLISALTDMTTSNLSAANAAIGNIRVYTVVTNSIKILTLPAAWLCLHEGLSPFWVMVVYVGFEGVCALVRLIFMRFNIGLSIRDYTRKVLIPDFAVLIVVTAVCYPLSTLFHGWAFLVTVAVSVVVTSAATWLFGLDDPERAAIRNMAQGLISRLFHNS